MPNRPAVTASTMGVSGWALKRAEASGKEKGEMGEGGRREGGKGERKGANGRE